jgi:hypothetical protein
MKIILQILFIFILKSAIAQSNVRIQYLDYRHNDFNKIKKIVLKNETFDSRDLKEPIFSCRSLIDSTLNLSNYGIFQIEIAQFPCNGVYLFYKDKGNNSLKFVRNYSYSSLLNFLGEYAKRNQLSDSMKVNLIYNFATFYDDFVYCGGPNKEFKEK